MTRSPAIFSVVLFAVLFAFSAAESAPPLSKVGCGEVIVRFTACLPYVSTVSDNSSATPPSECCDLFSSVYDSGEDACFCYLVRGPYLLEFTLDVPKIYSLNSLCSSTKARDSSLEVLCSGPVTLPRMRSPTDTNWLPNRFGNNDDLFAAQIDSPSSETPPSPPNSSVPNQISNNSSRSSRNEFLLEIMTSLAATFSIIFR